MPELRVTAFRAIERVVTHGHKNTGGPGKVGEVQCLGLQLRTRDALLIEGGLYDLLGFVCVHGNLCGLRLPRYRLVRANQVRSCPVGVFPINAVPLHVFEQVSGHTFDGFRGVEQASAIFMPEAAGEHQARDGVLLPFLAPSVLCL